MNRNSRRRSIAWSLLATMVLQICLPASAVALTSGPSQPEVQGFTPAGDPDIVDLFTGDASYNIPIMDVEGYPINLSYRAGITMDQEASWVGLGWTLSPGQVERTVRGLPDDFDGDLMTREMSMRPNRTLGFNLGANIELFGASLDPSPFSLSTSIQPSFNNYNGPRMELGATLSMRSTQRGKSGMTAGLGVSSTSDGSLTLQPSIGFDKAFESCNGWGKGGLNFGAKINSREGLQDVSFSASLMRGKPFTTRSSGTASIGSASFDLGDKVYSPEVTLPMDNFSISGSLQPVAVELWGTNTGFQLGGYYSRQQLAVPQTSKPAFGYLHLEDGENNASAMLDFSREGNGTYTPQQSHLPVASLACDAFSVTSQNMNGSYRAYRAAVGHVFDSRTTCTGSGGSIGAELGAGSLTHFGGDIIVNEQTSTCGDWTAYSPVSSMLHFGRTAGQAPEQVFFREANEAVVDRDPSQYNGFQGDQARRLKMASVGGFNYALLPQFDNGQSLPSQNALQEREPRATVFTYLTHAQVGQGLGLEPLTVRPPASPLAIVGNNDPIRGNHMSEITITGKDGSRNFYGLPAYNITQCDVSFAVQDQANTAGSPSYCTYGASDASAANGNGKDHFFSKNYTPAHAYAFLLTAAVSPDYSDADGVRGPSDGDLGTWHRFHYTLVDPEYHWRTPVGDHHAAVQTGMAYAHDDRANYSYGTKEIWSLHAVEGRNLMAVFFTSPRKDGVEVNEDGSVPGVTQSTQVKLDSIGLYTREQAAAAILTGHWPCSIKTAHFQYDYSLCPGTPNSVAGSTDGGPNGSQSKGKLTLRKLWFSYGCSKRGVTSPYRFQYGAENSAVDNPVYFADATDRWGGLRPVPGWDPGVGVAADLPTRDFPYAVQDEAAAKQLVQAWNLTRIKTPSAGVITVAYEPDRYGYVQDQLPTSMFRMVGANAIGHLGDAPDSGLSLSDAEYLKFEVPSGINTDAAVQALIPSGPIYYRTKVKVFQNAPPNNLDGYDYVSGYAEIAQDQPNAGYDSDHHVGWLRLQRVDIDNDNGGNVQPMFRSALEFARLNYPDRVFQPVAALVFDDQDESDLEGIILAAASASMTFMTGWTSFFQGPNAEIQDNQGGLCRQAEYTKSYLRLLSPNGVKFGGGHRVSDVTYADSWDEMTDTGPAMRYGKHYAYTEENGTTSGVAAYEPMMGADENCMRHPVYSDIHRCLSPDERFYQEAPFAESLYPSPTVGYRRVVVSDFLPDDGNVDPEQLAGYTVHEFYTAKDLPVRADRTSIDQQHATPGHFSLLNLLGFKSVDNMHVSQGMRVETNDMHGKPRKTEVYPQGASEPISSEEYIYATNGSQLSNTATVIEPDGTVHSADIGRHYEFLFDLRQFSSDASSSGVAINTDVILLFGPDPIFVPWPKFSSERTRFRSANFVKKIQRFGLLQKIIKTENGRTTTTQNLAYDAITGNVLLTEVNNDFKAPLYSMTIPAYWYYNGMGPGYRNVGLTNPAVNFTSGLASGLVDADKRFVPGDEVSLTQGNTVKKGWVSDVTAGSVKVMDDMGAFSLNGSWSLRVLRSGRRNMQSVPMTTLTMLNDPLAGVPTNTYSAVLNVQVVEFSDTWRTACECLTSGQIQPTLNPFILGTRGMWRLNKERAWLTERARSTENGNSDIRHDGIYTSYAPFYRLNNGKWEKHEAGWVTTRQVTDYSARGQELEDKDALGIYSSATFGRRGTLVKSIAKNASYRDQGFDDFEDVSPYDCGDRHFRIPGSYTTTAAHTGTHSLRVAPGSPASFSVALVSPCAYRDCTLSLSTAVGTPTVVMVNGGTAPYDIEPVPLSGDPVFTLRSHGDGISAGGHGSFQVTVTDATGCQATIQVQLP